MAPWLLYFRLEMMLRDLSMKRWREVQLWIQPSVVDIMSSAITHERPGTWVVDMKFQINLLNKKAPVNPGPHPYYCGRSHMHREKSTAPRDFLGWSSYREYRHACQGTTRERNTG